MQELVKYSSEKKIQEYKGVQNVNENRGGGMIGGKEIKNFLSRCLKANQLVYVDTIDTYLYK